MAAQYDIIYRGKPEVKLSYTHAGERWGYWRFERRGDIEADVCVQALQAEGYEATKVYVGCERKRDIDD